MRPIYTSKADLFNLELIRIMFNLKFKRIMKTKVYNLIVLDESGSMSGVTEQTILGCNETIEAIRASQAQFSDSQEHFVSIYAFQSDNERHSRYIIKNAPVTNVAPINGGQYEPWGCTPLYDAVGATLADLKALAGNDPNAVGSVTIITDGYENSSTHYTLEKVTRMIDALKEKGWNFNFIGANIDAHSVSIDFHIENHLQFEQSKKGTRDMFRREGRAKRRYNQRLHDVMGCIAPMASEEERNRAIREAEANYYKEDELDNI